MDTGTTLMKLKQDAQSAHAAVKNREERGSGWTILSWIMAMLAVATGFAATLTGMGIISGKVITFDFNYVGLGWVIEVGGVGLFALGFFLFILPYNVKARDKVLTSLREAEDTAYYKYRNALNEELATYGVDTNTIQERTDFKENDYDFTARRNGEPIDINVREFSDEIVFMLNGERMQKPVSA